MRHRRPSKRDTPASGVKPLPEPYWTGQDYDPYEPTNVGVEILGRGQSSRKSKTFIPDLELASILSRIANYPTLLMEQFRALHAHHYTVEVETKAPDGSKVLSRIPHVLTDAEICAKYPAVLGWRDAHDQSVAHYNSIKGFGVIRATSGNREPEKGNGDREDTSTGAKRGQQQARWQ